MNKYIDISDVAKESLADYIQVITKNNKIDHRLLYMPNLDYGDLEVAEDIAHKNKTLLLTIPITLPVMDIIHQAAHAGVVAKPQMVRHLEDGIRIAIKNCLEEEDSYELVANDEGSVGLRDEDDVLG